MSYERLVTGVSVSNCWSHWLARMPSINCVMVEECTNEDLWRPTVGSPLNPPGRIMKTSRNWPVTGSFGSIESSPENEETPVSTPRCWLLKRWPWSATTRPDSNVSPQALSRFGSVDDVCGGGAGIIGLRCCCWLK